MPASNVTLLIRVVPLEGTNSNNRKFQLYQKDLEQVSFSLQSDLPLNKVFESKIMFLPTFVF